VRTIIVHTSLADRVAASCAALIPPGSSVLAAVSGGGDSTALLLILHELKQKRVIGRLGVAHVNHGLRGKESDNDEVFVARLAKKLKIPFYAKKLSGRTRAESGMEEWARGERYKFFHGIMKKERYGYTATGHTADDQAETVLMRLMRGTGLRGLRGVLSLREDGVVRPLLDVWKRELHEFLRRKKVVFRHDASNDDCTYSRNRIRHAVLPSVNRREKKAAENLAAIAKNAQEFWKRYEPGVMAWIGENVEKSTGSFLVRKKGLPDALYASEGLRSVFEEYGIEADSYHLDKVLENSVRTSGQMLLPAGWRCFFRRTGIDFFKGHKSPTRRAAFSHLLKTPGITDCPGRPVRFIVESITPGFEAIPEDNLTVVLDRKACGDRLVFRSWKKDEQFQPLGRRSPVSVREFLAKQKISGAERSGVGVVAQRRGGIVWIPGIRISHLARVRSDSVELWKISYQSCPSII